MYAKEYNTTIYNVIKKLKNHADAQPNDQVANYYMQLYMHTCTYLFHYIQSILNLLRAVYGIEHFGYTIMRYCGLFKLSCCQDMKECLMSTDLKLPTTTQVFMHTIVSLWT